MVENGKKRSDIYYDRTISCSARWGSHCKFARWSNYYAYSKRLEREPSMESEPLVKVLKLTEDGPYPSKKALEQYLSTANDFLSYDEYVELSIEIDCILRNLGYEGVEIW